MNRHGIRTDKREIFFMSFKGRDKKSSLDQVTLPPVLGLNDHSRLFHRFGEWLKREGYGWECASEQQICQWAIQYWNTSLAPGDKPRRYHRLAKKADLPAHLDRTSMLTVRPRRKP